ncbi:lipoprotein-releasing ABC transporter permease subunit LolE [Psychromonas sp. 14N.309.X.WAT.B.A12]|uniref:lipoprotein-releasing ABC transporter permease subunit LolE n=1 Tax=unclassified Psychromonas TaxID=2614957 RepID=UPI0025B0FE90|nr:lipoprotein-releasing ABC transporter permease subunit LolE [Psychromonas sp. 14N.309.X.WAT.B.A12]MDN2663170.1 lipoprotein-releasing ABC transporter permease subunit LolE [Psychromonas sp. 14N.309.X.WAT.B.A12]
MFRPLSLFVGLRYSKAKHKNKFVSFISMASIFGIILGVAVLIVGLSTMNGFEKALRDQLLSVIPHAELEVVEGDFENEKTVLSKVREHPGVAGASPYIVMNALLQNNINMKALQMRAINPETETQVTAVEQYIKQGGWELLSSEENSIILGEPVAQQLKLAVGDTVTLLLPQPSTVKLRAPRKFAFTLTGTFKMGGQVDTTLGFIHINKAKQILDVRHATGIAFKVDDVLQAQTLAREVAYSIPVYMYVKSWITSQGYLYQDIQMVKSLMYVILLLVVAVACFNIVSTLVMAVNEKRGDIAILKTMGANKWSLRAIFMVQGAFNGLMGSFFGALLGTYLSLNLSSIFAAIESLLGRKFLSGDIYFIDYLPSQIDYQQVVVITIVAFVMSVVATIYPAWTASNIEPAKELGYSH